MLKGDHPYQRRQEKTLPNNEPSSGQRGITLSRFKKWLREKYPRVYGFFFSEPPFYIRHFFLILVLLGVIGGVAALWIPSNTGWLRQNGLSGEAEQKSISDLRLHFLYITGGIIAILTLLQTNWKNQGDRLKIDADIKKNEQDAEKNERDHIRQVHAERRSRYTKAVEQLANEKAAVRLGGIYTLVGLVDEWLDDKNLAPEEQQKEGQVIINNLCSYIRSPFTLALKAEMFEGDSEPDNYEGDFSKDQAAFHEEQDVRRTIFVEMSKRSSTFTREGIRKIIDTSLGTWSDFEFDFSRAPIFYPLNAITIEKGNFSGAKFYADANFIEATFTSNADFSKATFTSNAYFGETTFTSNAYFHDSTFNSNVYFHGSVFNSNAYFDGVYFGEVTCNSIADFGEVIFNSDAYFDEATFNSDAHFTDDYFLSGATFKGIASFSGATFKGITYFSGATFEKYSPLFVTTDDELGKTYRARFVALPINQQSHNFTVSDSSFPIPLGRAGLDGVEYPIPVGTVLFDPSSGETSQPAKPLENSDTEEEKPAG